MTVCASIVLGFDSGLPEDISVNTLSFVITPQGGETLADVIEREDPGTGTEWGIHESINDFYTAIDGLLSSEIDPAQCLVKYVDLSEPTPRFPFLELPLTSISTSGTKLPGEVALCLSFQGTRISGVPQASRRGRIFLGPLSTAMNVDGRPWDAGVTDIVNTASGVLLGRSNAVPDWDWVVHSTKNNSDAPITNGWVDNAFDTQRSRGLAPLVRSTFGT